MELPTLSPAFYLNVAVADEVRLYLEERRKQLTGGSDTATMSMSTEIVEQTGIELQIRSREIDLPVPLVKAWTDTFMSLSQGLSASELGSVHESVASQFDSARVRLAHVDTSLAQLDHDSGFASQELAVYLRRIVDLQDTVVSSRLRLVSVKAELARAEEIVKALEWDGAGLHTLGQTQRNRLASQARHPLTKQMLEIMAERDTPAQPPSLELDPGAETAISAIEQLPVADSLWAVRKELSKHSPVISLKHAVPTKDLLRRISEVEISEDLLRRIRVDHDGSRRRISEVENSEDLLRRISEVEISENLLTRLGEFEVSEGSLDRLTRLGLLSEELNLSFLHSEEPNPVYLRLKKEEARYGVKLGVAQHRLMAGLESDKFAAVLELYQESRRLVSSLVTETLTLQAEVAILEAGMRDQQSVVRRLRELSVEHDRLIRTRETLQVTFDRFAGLTEESRIAAQIASANLRVITLAKTPVGQRAENRRNPLLAGAIGLILSVFVAFFLEYVRKARAIRRAD